MTPLKLHHIGCAVASLEDALKPYTTGLGFVRMSEILEIPRLKIRVCFVEVSPGVFMEFVQGLTSDSPVAGFVSRRQSYYHVCYTAPNVMQAVEHLEANKFRRVSVFTSEAFSGNDCVFLLSPQQALIEIVQEGSFCLMGS